MLPVKEEILSPVDDCFDDFQHNNIDHNESSRNYSCSSNESTSTTSSELSLEIKDQIRSDFLQNEISLSDSNVSKIQSILESLKTLTEAEKAIIYMKLPPSTCHSTMKIPATVENSQNICRHPVTLSTSKLEQTKAFQWIRNNLEECDDTVNLPKQTVYEDYKAHCESQGEKRFLSAPDFGKIVKCVFPNVKARRLGTRGNSRYCYNGLKRKMQSVVSQEPFCDKTEVPFDVSETINEEESVEQSITAACKVICEWANKLLGKCFESLVELATFLVNGSYVSTKSISAFIVMSTEKGTIEKINDRFNIKILTNASKQHTPVSTSMETERPTNRASLANSICTPSKTVMGVTSIKKLNTASKNVPSQVVPHKQFDNKPVRINSTNKDITLKEFIIDASTPVYLDETSLVEYPVNKYDCYTEHVKHEPLHKVFTNSLSNKRVCSTTPQLSMKAEVGSPENVFPISVQQSTKRPMIQQSQPPPKSPARTPKKVGRPRNGTKKSQSSKTKNNPLLNNSPSIVSMMPPPSHLQGFRQQRFSQWPIPSTVQQELPQKQVPVESQHYAIMQQHQHNFQKNVCMGLNTNCDAELQNIFKNCPQTPPNQHVINNNNRCQSVPAPHNPRLTDYQPLTPQFNTPNLQPISQAHTFNAKRNLKSLFDEPTQSNQRLQNHDPSFNIISTSQDRIVPAVNSVQRSHVPQSRFPIQQQQQQNFSLFDEPTQSNQRLQNHDPSFNVISTSQDRIVPAVISVQSRVAQSRFPIQQQRHHQHQQQRHHQHQQQQQQQNFSGCQRKVTDELYGLGVTLNDLSTPEEMGDIPAAGLENIDGDDLIKSLQQHPNNNWASDWSTSTVPLMNIS